MYQGDTMLAIIGIFEALINFNGKTFSCEDFELVFLKGKKVVKNRSLQTLESLKGGGLVISDQDGLWSVAKKNITLAECAMYSYTTTGENDAMIIDAIVEHGGVFTTRDIYKTMYKKIRDDEGIKKVGPRLLQRIKRLVDFGYVKRVGSESKSSKVFYRLIGRHSFSFSESTIHPTELCPTKKDTGDMPIITENQLARAILENYANIRIENRKKDEEIRRMKCELKNKDDEIRYWQEVTNKIQSDYNQAKMQGQLDKGIVSKLLQDRDLFRPENNSGLS